MLKIRLGKVVIYANRDQRLMKRAVAEFFGERHVDQSSPNFEQISSLFNEWLIFDFKVKESRNWVTEYYLKNPDALPADQLAELEQIIKTQTFQMFEIESKRGQYVTVYGLYNGDTYKVFDKALSSNFPGKGSFWNRTAMVDGRRIFVGGNPSFFPITNTPRARKIFLKENGGAEFTAKMALDLLMTKRKEKDPFEDLPQTPQELEISRQKIQKRYSLLASRHGFTPTFDDVVHFVFVENYNHNEADFYTDLIKMGIPEKVLFKHYQLFGDIWNHFPHKKLKGKSPVEL